MPDICDPLDDVAPWFNAPFIADVLAYEIDARGTPDLLDPSLIEKLQHAVDELDVAQVAALIQQDNGYGDPLLYWLVKRDAAAVQRFIAEGGEQFDIFLASFFGDAQRTQTLVRANPEGVHSRNANSWTPLDIAAHEGHHEVVGILVEAGADPNTLRPILWAAQNGHDAVVRLLLQSGRVSAEHARDALSRAVYRNRPAVVSTLLAHGVSAKGLLGCAAYGSRTKGKVDILRTLLEYGADVHERDDKGYTALYSQISFYGDRPDREITDFLVEQGAPVDIFNASGLGLLNHLRALLDEDPLRVHATTADGCTPLHYAAMGNQLEAAQLLVTAGARRDAVDAKNERPADKLRETDGHYVTCDTAPLREFLTVED